MRGSPSRSQSDITLDCAAQFLPIAAGCCKHEHARKALEQSASLRGLLRKCDACTDLWDEALPTLRYGTGTWRCPKTQIDYELDQSQLLLSLLESWCPTEWNAQWKAQPSQEHKEWSAHFHKQLECCLWYGQQRGQWLQWRYSCLQASVAPIENFKSGAQRWTGSRRSHFAAFRGNYKCLSILNSQCRTSCSGQTQTD